LFFISAAQGSGVDEDAAEADQMNVANLPPGTKTTFQVMIQIRQNELTKFHCFFIESARSLIKWENIFSFLE